MKRIPPKLIFRVEIHPRSKTSTETVRNAFVPKIRLTFRGGFGNPKFQGKKGRPGTPPQKSGPPSCSWASKGERLACKEEASRESESRAAGAKLTGPSPNPKVYSAPGWQRADTRLPEFMNGAVLAFRPTCAFSSSLK